MPQIEAKMQDKLHHLMERGIRLPSMPATGAELLSMLRRPADQINLHKLAESIENDPPLAARILRVSNSPMYGAKRGVTRVGQALVVLGLDETLSALNYYLLRRMFDRFSDLPDFTADHFWKHALAIGSTARMLGQPRYLVAAFPGELYTAGLLHDIGKIVLAMNMREEFAECLKLAREEGIPLFEAERRTIGFDHAMLGGQMLDNWNLPPVILDAVACHHDPEEADPQHRECAALVQYTHALLAAAGDIPAGDPAPISFSETWFCRTKPDSPLADESLHEALVARVKADLAQRSQAYGEADQAASAEEDAADSAPSAAASKPAFAPVAAISPKKSFWGRLVAVFS